MATCYAKSKKLTDSRIFYIFTEVKKVKIYRIAQNANILVQNFGVHESVAQEVEQLLANIPKQNNGLRRYIIKIVKQSPPQIQQDVVSLDQEIQNQLSQLQQSKPNIPAEIGTAIQKTTDVKEHRDWLAHTFSKNAWQLEDLPGIQKDLEAFLSAKNTGKIDTGITIDTFETPNDLFDFVSEYRSKPSTDNIPPEGQGWEKIDEMQTNNYNVKLIEIFDEEVMRQIGAGTNWCVARNSFNGYNPPIYYCFLIDNEPMVLLHPQSQQLGCDSLQSEEICGRSQPGGGVSSQCPATRHGGR